jgi:short-subunit dehydrogenase
MEISGRRVLVTGASRGIGEELARAFARAGARVALVARSEEPLKHLAAELGGVAFPADLLGRDAVAGLIERVEADGGGVDVLVNNAGLATPGWFPQSSPDDVERVYRLNTVVPAELCRQAIPRMLDRGGGHVVNVSSMAGTAAFPGLALYSSSKAGLSHLTAGLRADLRGLPVGTTLVELGPVPTEMREEVGEYPPVERSFQRFYRLRLLVDADRATVAEAVVAAVAKGRRHVRIPRRAALFPMLAETPRRLAEALLTGVPHR